MTQSVIHRAGAAPAASRSSTPLTRALLACGVLAGPLFVVVAAIQALTRDGFDLGRHPLSLLSLGELGWIQIVNFVLAGALAVAGAVGMRRALHPGRAGTWGPILVGAFGVGLILGGVFLADPSLGFPTGAPQGIPAESNWHATVHNVAPGLALDAAMVASFVFARRFAGLGQRVWMAYCVVTGVALIVLSFWPSLDGISVRLAVAVTLAFALVAAVATRLLTEARS